VAEDVVVQDVPDVVLDLLEASALAVEGLGEGVLARVKAGAPSRVCSINSRFAPSLRRLLGDREPEALRRCHISQLCAL
jgi:hypothetical protein